MDKLEYTTEERLVSFAQGILLGAVVLGMSWALIVLAWAGAA
jgi:hypothetical protein